MTTGPHDLQTFMLTCEATLTFQCSGTEKWSTFFVNMRFFFTCRNSNTVSKDFAFLHPTVLKKNDVHLFSWHCIILHNSRQGALYSQLFPRVWSCFFACWVSSDISKDTKTSEGNVLQRKNNVSLYL